VLRLFGIYYFAFTPNNKTDVDVVVDGIVAGRLEL